MLRGRKRYMLMPPEECPNLELLPPGTQSTLFYLYPYYYLPLLSLPLIVYFLVIIYPCYYLLLLVFVFVYLLPILYVYIFVCILVHAHPRVNEEVKLFMRVIRHLLF